MATPNRNARALALSALPVWILFVSCVCIVWLHGPAHARTELDEAGALRLAEGSGYVKVHRDPTVNGHDQIIAPHGYASLHEQKALDLASGKIRGDIGGRWKAHQKPHSTAGKDKAEERALALAEGRTSGDAGGRWIVHHHPHVTAGSDKAEEKALALAEGKVHGDVGGRWKIHHAPHSVSGHDEKEERALALAEGKVHPHPYGRAAHAAHAVHGNSAQEKRALALAEGRESDKVRESIASGHATAVAKHDEDKVTIQTKWGPLSAARGGSARQQQLRSIEARLPNVHFDQGVSAKKVKALLARAEHMTGERFGIREKKESPLVQLNQISELNAISNKEAREQHAMETGKRSAHPLGPAASVRAHDWRRAARGRRDTAQTRREALALKLAEEPSAPVGMPKAAKARKPAKNEVAGRKGKDWYHQAVFEEKAIAERKAELAKKQRELKDVLARKHAAAKAHQALRGMDVLAHGAQKALSDDMVSASAIRRGWLGL